MCKFVDVEVCAQRLGRPLKEHVVGVSACTNVGVCVCTGHSVHP